MCNLENKVGSLEVGKSFDAIVVNIRNTPASPASPHHPNIWGVGDDEELRIETRRRRGDVGVADGDAMEDTSVEKRSMELDAMLERFLFCGDDRNLRRVYVQGRWVGGTEGPARA